jgi:hypothetical protein
LALATFSTAASSMALRSSKISFTSFTVKFLIITPLRGRKSPALERRAPIEPPAQAFSKYRDLLQAPFHCRLHREQLAVDDGITQSFVGQFGERKRLGNCSKIGHWQTLLRVPRCDPIKENKLMVSQKIFTLLKNSGLMFGNLLKSTDSVSQEWRKTALCISYKSVTIICDISHTTFLMSRKKCIHCDFSRNFVKVPVSKH